MKKIKLAILLFTSTVRLVLFLLRQYLFLKKHFLQEWKKRHAEDDGSFNRKKYRRLFYYALQLPVMLGDSFALWRGRKLTTEERFRITLLCAFTPLLDDWFDEELLDIDVINARIFRPETFQPANQNETLAKFFIMELYRRTPGETDWISSAYELLKAQEQRRRQEKNPAEITQNMGGYSVLLARQLLDAGIGEQEKEAVLTLGFGVQLLDDVFDVYEDSRAGLPTIPVEGKDMTVLTDRFLALIKEIRAKSARTAYNKKQNRLFLAFWWSFFARGLVCLEQLTNLQRYHGGDFQPLSYDRKELICDMEKFRNIKQYIRFYLRHDMVYPDASN